MKICKLKDCNREYYARGVCHTHYCYRLRTGSLRRKKPNKEKICKLKNCNKPVLTKGYCSFHYSRKIDNISLNVPKNWGKKGRRNAMWKGGVAEYPNHYLLKKNRLIILINNPKCEICGKPAVGICLRNGDKSDYRLSNLMPSCHGSGCRLYLKKYNSKYRRLYDKTLEELGKEFNLTSAGISYRIENKIVLTQPKFTHNL